MKMFQKTNQKTICDVVKNTTFANKVFFGDGGNKYLKEVVFYFPKMASMVHKCQNFFLYYKSQL